MTPVVSRLASCGVGTLVSDPSLHRVMDRCSAPTTEKHRRKQYALSQLPGHVAYSLLVYTFCPTFSLKMKGERERGRGQKGKESEKDVEKRRERAR